MPNITLKNIPDKLYRKLRKRAQQNRRSMNNEIIKSLEDSFGTQKVNIDQLLSEAAGIRNNLTFVVNEKDIEYAKKAGRL